MNPMMTLNNAQNEFVKNLLSNLEKNHIPWRPTWDITITKPYNAVSNREYKGVNQLNLWMTSIQHGFADPRWLTFKQANEKGYRIKKGSVGTYVSNYGLRNIETKELINQEDLSKLSPEELKKIKPFAKTYKVFNAKQIEGIPEIDLRSKEIAFENDKAEAFTNTLLKNIQLDVIHAGSEAFYTPSEDKVYLPKQDAFVDEQAFYATEMHEVAHATSHATRLNREVSTAFGSDKYAIEELRAELTSAFLTLDLGFHFDKFHEDNHTAYIQSWSNQIKDNPKVVFDSISDAQKIRQYMLDKGEYSEIYKQEKPTIERASLTEDGYIPGNLDNVIQNPIKKYPYTFKHILTEKETVILYKLGVPINVQCGFLDKNDNYYTNIQLDELTKKTSIDEDFAWREENGIQFAGHKILKEEDLLILKDSYAHGYIDPSFISFDQMDSFIATFEYLTDSKYHILDETTCNSIQEKMIENAPLTLEKIVNYKNKYLNDDVIRAASTKNEWIIAAKHQNMNPLDMIKDNIIEDLAKISEDTLQGIIQDEDIFKSTSQVIVNPVNLKGVMGAGLAKEFKNRYPTMFEEYKEKCINGELREGNLHLFKTNEHWILNFPTKNDYRDLSTIELIEKGLIDLRDNYKSMGIESITFPKIGSGLGGLDWQNQVLPMIHKRLDTTDLVIGISGESYKKELQSMHAGNIPSKENPSAKLDINQSVPEHNDGTVLDSAPTPTADNKKTVVINLFAGPSAGKTTAAWEIAAELKKMNYVTEYVPEYAKELAWDNRRDLLDGSVENQRLLLKEQSHRIERLVGKVDFVVTDAPTLLNVMYLKEDDPILAEEYKFSVLTTFNKYTNFNMFVTRSDHYEQAGRIHTEEQSKQIDSDLKKLLKEANVFYGTYMQNSVDLTVKNAITTYDRINNVSTKASSKAMKDEKTLTKNLSLDDMKNSISIVDYAQEVLGFNVIKESRGMFRIEEHDSCKIYPNNTFYRYSRSKGGSIIDFIKHFEECDTKEAISKMQEYYAQYHPEIRYDSKTGKATNHSSTHDMELPEKAETNKHVFTYLTQTRGIKPSIVQEYMDRKILYEDTNRNCVFVGKLNGTIAYATLRSSNAKATFKQDVLGSAKEVGVYIDNKSDTLIVNEAVIDQMSYQCLASNPKAYSYLSSCGAANCMNAVRLHMVKRPEAQNLKKIIIGLDDDEAGEVNTLKTIEFLKDNYPNIETLVHLPEGANDFNDQLKTEMNLLANIAKENMEYESLDNA